MAAPKLAAEPGLANQGRVDESRESVRDDISGVFECQLCRCRNGLALQWWGKDESGAFSGRAVATFLHPGLRTPLTSQRAVRFNPVMGISRVRLAGLWCLLVWSNTSLDVAVKVCLRWSKRAYVLSRV